MKKKNVTNKDIMKRLDDLENRTAWMSRIFLLVSVAIALIIVGISQESITNIYLPLGLFCYVFAGLLAFKHKIKF